MIIETYLYILDQEKGTKSRNTYLLDIQNTDITLSAT